MRTQAKEPIIHGGSYVKPKITNLREHISDIVSKHPEAFKVNRIQKLQRFVQYMRNEHPDTFKFAKDRHGIYVVKRHAFYYVCACADNPELFTICKGVTLTDIGTIYGQDHSMVIYARDLITDLLKTKQAEAYMDVVVGLINSLIKD